MSRSSAPDKRSREYQYRCIVTAQLILIVVLVLTVADIIMLLCNASTYFPLTVSSCFYLALFCRLLDGGAFAGNTIGALCICAVLLAAYIVCIVLTRRRFGWLTVAAVLYSVDAIVLIGLVISGFWQASFCIVDLLLHAFVVWQIFRGVLAAKRLRSSPPVEHTSSEDV